MATAPLEVILLIKSADDKSQQIKALRALAARSDIDAQTRGRIDKEIRDVERGAKGEREAAYEIEFSYKNSENWAIIHDLRFECDGHTAQIDHLLISRWLEVWVCETKFFSGDVVINDHGEFEVDYQSRRFGIASPLEQNKKHIKALERAVKSKLIKTPSRLGFSLKPSLNSVILLSQKSLIHRPSANVEGIESLVKIDQFISRINHDINSYSDLQAWRHAIKVVSSNTLKRFAEDIAALHKPARYDWAGKFGVSAQGPA